MRRWALVVTLLSTLVWLLLPAWSLTLSGSPGSLPTVSCPDTGGNHLNFTGGVWTCGVSSSGGAPGNAKADSTTKGIATFTSEFTDNGSGLIGLAAGLNNHTFSNTNTFFIRDDRFSLQDSGDTSKQAQFQLSGITSGQTRVFTLPNVDGTLGLLPGFDCADTGGQHLNFTVTGGYSCGTSSSGAGGSSAFSSLTSGTNIAAAMVVGSGATLTTSGTGFIAATTTTGWASPRTGCAANQYATSQDITGNLGCQQVALSQVTGTVSDAQLVAVTAGGTCTNCSLTVDTKGRVTGLASGGSGGSSAFSALTSGTNITAVMVVGSGASLSATGGGSIAATTALALAVDPTACSANQFVTDIANVGTLTCAQPSLATLSDGASAVTLAGTQILTNKQLVPRPATPTVTANTITPNCDTTDLVIVDSLSADLTINDPSPCTGSNPRQGQRIEFRLKSTTPRALTWGSAYTDGAGVPLVTSTTGNGSAADRILYEHNLTTAKWEHIATTRFPLVTFTVTKNLPVTGVKFPATNAARLDRSGETDKLLFAQTTPAQCVSWQLLWPTDYTSGGTVRLNGSMASATSGSINYDVSLWKLTPGATVDVDTVSYDTANACNTATVPSTAGFPFTVSCALTNKDGVAAGDNVLLKLCRNTSSTAPNDAEIGFAELSYVH